MDSFEEIFYRCFPVIKWIRDYFKIKAEINDLFNQKYVVKRVELNFDDKELFNRLNKLNKKELKRKETIEDKGKSILLVLTLTGTILMGTINLFFKNIQIDKLQIIILFLAILYLIISICLILSVINSSMFSDLYLNDMFDILNKGSKVEHSEVDDFEGEDSKVEDSKEEISKNEIRNLFIKNISEEDKIGELIRSIELNQLTLQRKANDLSCGLTALQRSFIILFIFVLTLGINKFFPNTTTNLWNLILNFLPIC